MNGGGNGIAHGGSDGSGGGITLHSKPTYDSMAIDRAKDGGFMVKQFDHREGFCVATFKATSTLAEALEYIREHMKP